MTPILAVITGYCDKYINDITISDLKETDSPLYCRKMWEYLKAAIPNFTIPVGIQSYLAEGGNLTEPMYDSTSYIADETHTSTFGIELGAEFAGYELASCRMRKFAGERVYYRPMRITYNSENGVVTVILHDGDTVEDGSELELDFYKDGNFAKDLSAEAMNILGMLSGCVWQAHFNADWLSMVSKVEDKSFYEQNRANKMNADTERITQLLRDANEAMHTYENSLAYKKIVPLGDRLI